MTVDRVEGDSKFLASFYLLVYVAFSLLVQLYQLNPIYESAACCGPIYTGAVDALRQPKKQNRSAATNCFIERQPLDKTRFSSRHGSPSSKSSAPAICSLTNGGACGCDACETLC